MSRIIPCSGSIDCRRSEKDGVTAVRFAADPGLYRFSLFLDASGFDWETLYQTLNVYQNHNERTGPWDFELATARPLVPSWWVHLDGKKLGLWYVQRVSLPDVENRRFRGCFAFDITGGGDHELTFAPFRDAQVEWIEACVEPDPEDTLDWTLAPQHPASALGVARWAAPAFWQARQAELETTHAEFRAPLQAVFDWTRRTTDFNPEGIPFLVAAAHLDRQDGALEKALLLVDRTLDLPAWGRPAEDVYGHNGDIGGALTLRCMAWAYHMLGDSLGEERRQRLLDRLARQGGIFMTQILLMRDYWGGSLLQDHGRRAVHDFGTAAMCLWGIVPEAARWVAYLVPRIARGLDAAPRDGVIPGSSYISLHMYTDAIMWYREALMDRTGQDVLDHPSLRDIPAFVDATVDERIRAMTIAEYSDLSPLLGGGLFMERVASVRRDPVAARICRLLLREPEQGMATSPYTVAAGFLWGFLAHDSSTQVLTSPPRPSRDLRCYDDSGFVHYRDDASGVTLAVKCGPWLGYHAQRHATGPCDLMECLPAGGHFALYLGGRPVLVSPDTGYSLRSALRSCLLVDDEGQIGDVGYPMSIPSQPHRGDRIAAVRWDAATGTGSILLDLSSAYPAALGVLRYTREFAIAPGSLLICRDRVVLDRPRRLAWLFQFRKDDDARIGDGGRAEIGGPPAILCIEPRPGMLELDASVRDTKVVYSYSSAFKRFRHVRYETAHPVRSATVEFHLSWPSNGE
jgi:hypothetical protein